MRTLALWFPDWPIQVARHSNRALALVSATAQGSTSESTDRSALLSGKVVVADAQCRAAGIRRGMSARHAVSLLPEVELMAYSPARDAQVFEHVLHALADNAIGIEIMRPGLVLIQAEAASRYYGSEEKAVQLLIDAATSALDFSVDLNVGVADELATAVLAARVPYVVPPGRSENFLKSLPLHALKIEPCLEVDGGVVDTLMDIGIRSFADLLKIPAPDLMARFGAAGMHCRDIAAGKEQARSSLSAPSADLSISFVADPPIDRVDRAAFIARQLAAQLHEALKAAGKVCLRLRISAEDSHGRVMERVWRTREPLSEEATMDRVRWQLDSWVRLNAQKHELDAAEEAPAGIELIGIEPVELSLPDSRSLWGEEEDTQARRAIARVQSSLGMDAVVQPHLQPGRGVAERIGFVPYGEDRKDDQGLWPGRIPGPLPTRIAHPATRVSLVDSQGQAIRINEQAMLSAVPHELIRANKRYQLAGWAGPWPVEGIASGLTRGGMYLARLQCISTDNHGWLLVWVKNSWRVEADYS